MGGVGLKIFASVNTLKNLPAVNGEVKVLPYEYQGRRTGYLWIFNQTGIRFFTKLIGVNGVGPKTALNILNIDTAERLMAGYK